MEILRSDGGGRSNSDERLKCVRKKLIHCPIEKIALIHDHKGTLNVHWLDNPSEVSIKIVELIWEAENEYCLNHYLLNPRLIREIC